MRGSKPLALDVGRRIRPQPPDLLRDRPVIGTDHHRKGSLRPVRRRRQHMRQQRLAGDLVQDLRRRGTHPRALAGREHDREAGPAGHP
jgi:hypothetical protein